jgi:hypothetical protein
MTFGAGVAIALALALAFTLALGAGVVAKAEAATKLVSMTARTFFIIISFDAVKESGSVKSATIVEQSRNNSRTAKARYYF